MQVVHVKLLIFAGLYSVMILTEYFYQSSKQQFKNMASYVYFFTAMQL